MAVNTNQPPKQKRAEVNVELFGRENYIWMIAGALAILLGYLLMAGGKSDNPNVFNPKEVYSPIRITVAPIVLIGGFILEIIGIMKKPRAKRIAE